MIYPAIQLLSTEIVPMSAFSKFSKYGDRRFQLHQMNDQPPVGLTAQLVEYCTIITDLTSAIRPEFFSPPFYPCILVSTAHNCKDHITFLYFSFEYN